jgi:hypothetical protein
MEETQNPKQAKNPKPLTWGFGPYGFRAYLGFGA